MYIMVSTIWTFLAVNKDGTEVISHCPMNRDEDEWVSLTEDNYGCPEDMAFKIPKGTIRKIIGKELTWADEPFMIDNDK